MLIPHISSVTSARLLSRRRRSAIRSFIHIFLFIKIMQREKNCTFVCWRGRRKLVDVPLCGFCVFYHHQLLPFCHLVQSVDLSLVARSDCTMEVMIYGHSV